jgi:hypothetical protein
MNRLLADTARTLLDKIAPLCNDRIEVHGSGIRTPYLDTQSMIVDHFNGATPQCRSTITHALELLNCKHANIIETGSSAWGVNSSMLFDSYVNSFGGTFTTVDMRLVPLVTLKGRVTNRSSLHCNDSVLFLEKIAKAAIRLDLVYLDSWDVDWSNPLPAGYHGLKEFLTILPLLSASHGILLVDDTPSTSESFHIETGLSPSIFESYLNEYGCYPGKGGLILNYLRGINLGTVVEHGYQMLIKF